MGEWLARAITVGSIVLTFASLTVAVVFARKANRIRVGFDVARAAVGVIAILAMAAITGVVTPLFAVVLAIAGGLALGLGQGSSLEVTSSERGLSARRNPVGIALWGIGILVMQGAGLASRTGIVKFGQAVAWFSVCLGIGLLIGRNGPLRGARQTLAGAGAAVLVAAFVAPAVGLVGGVATPAVADTSVLTDDEVCALLVPETSDLLVASGDGTDPLPGRDFLQRTDYYFDPLAPITAVGAACRQPGYEGDTGGQIGYSVYHFASDGEARAQYDAEVAANEAWYAPELELARAWFDKYPTGLYGIGTGPLDEYGVTGRYWIAATQQRVLMAVGPFMLYGVVADDLAFEYGEVRADRTHEPSRQLVETLITPMADTVHNIESYLAMEPPEPVDDETTTTVQVAEADEDEAASAPENTQQEDVALPPVTDEPSGDEPIEPEEAAGQAVAGLVAAAAIGLITLGEASGEIGRILGGGGGSGSTPPTPSGPFIDPYDQKPLTTDPETGMVWWPWGGGEGRWVDAAVVPGLLDDWNRELDAETARRVAAHDAQADRDWADLRRTTREQTRAELDRLEAERSRRIREGIVADRIRDIAEEVDFDAMVAWIDENPLPTGAELDALRASLSRHLGVHKAIGAMPTNAELWRTAIIRTIGSDADWDKDHVTVADVADLVGMGALLRNPEITARVGAAMATGGWSEVAVIPLVDVRRAIEDANNAREAAGLPDLTADEARFISNVTIIKAITIDQVIERGLPVAINAVRGTDAAAREAAEASLGRSITRGRMAASEAVETSARRALPGDEALSRSADEGLARAAPDGPRPPGDGDFGTMGGRGDEAAGAAGRAGDEGLTTGRRPSSGTAPTEPTGGGGTPRGGPPDEIIRVDGPAVPGRTPPPGVHPPKPPQSAIDDLTLGRGPQQDSLGGPGVQKPWDGDPQKIFEGMDEGAQAARPPSTTPAPPRGLEEPPGIELGGVDEFQPGMLDDVYGRGTQIEPVTAEPGRLDPGDYTHPPWIDEIEGIKDVDELGLTGGSRPPIDPSPTPPAPRPSSPPPIDPASPPPGGAPPARPPNQDLSDAILRGEEPPGAAAADDLEFRSDERFAGTRHDGQAGWSAEALNREETFWTAGRSDVTPIIGPSGGDVAPAPRGFNVQMNPRTRTATPILGEALTPTQKATIMRPGGPFDQAVERINRILDDLETSR